MKQEKSRNNDSASSNIKTENTGGISMPAVSPLLQRKENDAGVYAGEVAQRVQMTYNSGNYVLILTDDIRDHIWDRHGSDVAWGVNHDDTPGLFAVEFLPGGKAALDALAQHLFDNGEWAGGQVYLNYGVGTGWGYNAANQFGYFRGVRMFCDISDDEETYTITTLYPAGGFVVYVPPQQEAAEPVADAVAVVDAPAVDAVAPPVVADAVVDNAQQAGAGVVDQNDQAPVL